jgi:uncharacterized protein (DUF58 family)
MAQKKIEGWEDVEWKRREFPFLKAGQDYINELMEEIDATVRELVDVFKFALKYKILFRGTGLEFDGLKEYVPGEDDAAKIDWKSSLRGGQLYVKRYEEERDLDTFILLDASSSMLLGTQKELKSEYAAVLAGALAFAAIESNDNVGFSMFSDEMMCSVPPQKGPDQYYRILRLMADPRNYGGGCNLEKALTGLTNTLRAKTILFVVSDFIGIGDKWEDGLKMASAKFDKVLGLMVLDVIDSKIPEGVGYIRTGDPFSSDGELTNLDKLRGEYNKSAAERERRIEEIFNDSGAGFAKIYTNEPFVEPLIKYLQMSSEVMSTSLTGE